MTAPRLALSAREQWSLRDLRASLATYVDNGPSTLTTILRPLREFLATERTATYCLAPHGDAVSVESHHFDGWPDPVSATAAFAEFVGRTPIGWSGYNPLRPEPTQRNAALRFADLPSNPSTNPAGREMFRRVGLSGFDQLRVLVCEGPSLLAWVGGLQSEPYEGRQRAKLARLVPSLVRRLSLERLLRDGVALGAVLSAALEAIARPAFLVGSKGQIRHLNRAATLLRERDRRGTDAALAECARRPSRAVRFTVTRVRSPGLADHFLVVGSSDRGAELEARAAAAATTWSLSARQTQVLALVARGLSNRTIAACLAISERTVEIHVSAILERAQAESRAELTAKVWMQ